MRGRDGRVRDDAAHWTLALALGCPLPDAPISWEAVLEVAEAEGCAPLCWSRGAAVIRSRAPRAVADAFRARTIAVAARAARQVATLRGTLAALEAADAAPVVLKGAPLALLAHGDALVRQSADVDLLVPRAARARAAAALSRDGWRLVQGAAPWEETWLRGDGERVEHLELQSAPFGEMLVHLEPATLPTTRSVVEGVAMTVLAPAVQPTYLAVHLARHRLAPLLWFADLAALWGGLAPALRDEAERFATRHGLERYLRWALARGEAARRVARGELAALGALGRVTARGRAIGHPAIRDLLFAPGPRAALQALAAWAVPPTTRGARDVALARVTHRLRRVARIPAAAPAPAPSPAVAPAARALDVSREELGEVVGAVAAAGGTLWLRVHGRSMQPAIPSEALVHLVPPPARPLHAGEVALARLPDGSFALHRVLAEQDGRVRLRGDAVVLPDPTVERAAILACADLMDAGGGVRPVPAREPLTMFRVLRPLRTLRMRLRRAPR